MQRSLWAGGSAWTYHYPSQHYGFPPSITPRHRKFYKRALTRPFASFLCCSISSRRLMCAGSVGTLTLWWSHTAYIVFPSTDSITPLIRAIVRPCCTTVDRKRTVVSIQH